MIEYIILAGIVLVILIVVFWYIGTYNSFISLQAEIPRAWSNIEVLLKQRYDELPKLIDSVKGYMKHERGTLKELTEARTAWSKAKTIKQKAAASDMISSALKTVFAVAENYPQLRATENFKHLQERISGLENEIADRREFYNESATIFNIRIKQFPANIVAKNIGLSKPYDLFKAGAHEMEDVKVKF